jgi:hypothetical protein
VQLTSSSDLAALTLGVKAFPLNDARSGFHEPSCVVRKTVLSPQGSNGTEHDVCTKWCFFEVTCLVVSLMSRDRLVVSVGSRG